MGYLIGTTWQCYNKIMEDGWIKTKPPQRVWKDYSEEYVYLVPFNENNYEEAILFATEQASFAVYELGHTRRVILEIEGIEEEALETDPHSTSIGGVQYPYDIPISCIQRVHIEKGMRSRKIKELIAISFFLRKEETFWINVDDICYGTKKERVAELERIDIKHLGLLPSICFQDEGELLNRYHDLREELDLEMPYRTIVLAKEKVM